MVVVSSARHWKFVGCTVSGGWMMVRQPALWLYSESPADCGLNDASEPEPKANDAFGSFLAAGLAAAAFAEAEKPVEATAAAAKATMPNLLAQVRNTM